MTSNETITKKAAILLGGCGVLGSLLLFAGDMLFYYNGAHTNLLENMAYAAPERIILSAVFALLATWLYVAGAGQIYYAFQPENAFMRWVVFFSFVMIMIAYGVIHAAYVSIVTSAQNAVAVELPPQALTTLAITINQTMRRFVYLPFAVFTLGFTISVWRKQTHYPRWVLLFSPIVPFLLQGTIVSALEGSAKTIIGGGYLNLILLLFFTASTMALVTRKET